MKKCNNCKIDKDYSDYHKSKQAKDGYRSECKTCRSKESKKYYNENILIRKEYLETNFEVIKQKKKDWNNSNKDKVKVTNENYRNLNIDSAKKYRIINSKILKEKRKEYKKIKFSDPIFKLKHNIGVIIRNSLKNNNYTKKSRSYEILGCSFEEFKTHLESKFEAWMTWDNHGKYNGTEGFGWDIDHIIPLSSGTTEEEIIKLNNYTNLQPLCSKINRYVKRGVWQSSLVNKSS
jgi:hypothetical protein